MYVRRIIVYCLLDDGVAISESTTNYTQITGLILHDQLRIIELAGVPAYIKDIQKQPGVARPRFSFCFCNTDPKTKTKSRGLAALAKGLGRNDTAKRKAKYIS